MNSPIATRRGLVFEGPVLPETDSEDEGLGSMGVGGASGVAEYRRHQEAMAVALSLGSRSADAAGDSSSRLGEHRQRRQRSIEAVLVSNLVSMGFSDERSAEAARAAMLTNPSDEDALEAALTFLAQSPRADDSPPPSAEEQQVQGQGVDATDVELSLPAQMEEELACVATPS